MKKSRNKKPIPKKIFIIYKNPFRREITGVDFFIMQKRKRKKQKGKNKKSKGLKKKNEIKN